MRVSINRVIKRKINKWLVIRWTKGDSSATFCLFIRFTVRYSPISYRFSFLSLSLSLSLSLPLDVLTNADNNNRCIRADVRIDCQRQLTIRILTYNPIMTQASANGGTMAAPGKRYKGPTIRFLRAIPHNALCNFAPLRSRFVFPLSRVIRDDHG
jgi:hypothetical protein